MEFYSLTSDNEDDKCVALDLLFKFNDTLYLVHRAYDDSSKYSIESTGNVLLYAIIQKAIEEGITTYNFLRGDEDYKFRAANDSIQNYTYKLSPPSQMAI